MCKMLKLYFVKLFIMFCETLYVVLFERMLTLYIVDILFCPQKKVKKNKLVILKNLHKKKVIFLIS